jgi:hypothetical protein
MQTTSCDILRINLSTKRNIVINTAKKKAQSWGEIFGTRLGYNAKNMKLSANYLKTAVISGYNHLLYLNWP